jgi:hypothetical protein
MAPAINVKTNARAINDSVPGSANAEIEEKITIDIAVVGPDIRCHEDP